MKKMFFAAIVALFAVTTVSAQTPGNWAVGPKIGVYTNTGADGAIFGIGASGRYSFTDNWRMESGIMAICKKDRKSTRLNSSHTDSSRMPSSA